MRMRRERHAGSHPSLAEGYILHIPLITHRHRSSQPPSNPTPSLILSTPHRSLPTQPLTLVACRRMGVLQVHLDIGRLIAIEP